MIIQIYNTLTPEEGIALAKAGVNQIGIVACSCGLPGEIDIEIARKIVEVVGNQAVKVALTGKADVDTITKMVNYIKPDVLHLCGDINIMTPTKVAELARMIPNVKIMQAIPVVNHEAVEIAKRYQNVADYLILDSFSKEIKGIGAAGFTHDWNISREIVKNSRIPVILAGGLSPDNVAEAIKFVRPWGVDSMTFTNKSLGNGKVCKDMDLVKAFIKAAKEAAKEIEG